MRVILNIIWLLFAGVWLALLWVFIGVALMLTIIGIPFGYQAFKIAGFALWPFGRMVVKDPTSEVREASTVGNVIWIVLAGWWLALLHVIVGLLLVITIIGIPLGLGVFRMIPITFAPFGREIVPEETTTPSGGTVAVPSRWTVGHPA